MNVVTSPKSNRRWLRFSLRTLIILMCVTGVVLGLLGNLLIRIRHQRQIIARIEAVGGKWNYDHHEYYEPEPGFYFPLPAGGPEPPGPRWLRRTLGDDAFAHVAWVSFDSYSNPTNQDIGLLADLPRLRFVEIDAPGLTDAGLTDLSRLPNLRYLKLGDPRVTADGYRRLQAAKSLEILEINGGAVTDEAFGHLAALPHLRALKIQSSKFTEKGVAHLARCEDLEQLSLADGHVDDGWLVHLLGLARLQHLEIQNLYITDADTPHLATMTQLRTLFVECDYITDAGLRNLHKLKGLQSLQIYGGEFTHDGTIELKEALPQCELITPYASRTKNEK